MGNELLKLRTKDSLLEALQASLSRKPTAEEVREQRVSFVYGSLSSRSNVTRDQVRQRLVEQEGRAA